VLGILTPEELAAVAEMILGNLPCPALGEHPGSERDRAERAVTSHARSLLGSQHPVEFIP
jgi:hypothetical protein